MNRNSTKSISMLLVIFLASALNACAPSQAQSAAIAATASGKPAVTPKDQEYDGSTVVVPDAYSQGPGWLVIHNQQNGATGPAIGETHLNDGDNKNIVVRIDPAQVTPVLYAMLHKDGGVVGAYEFPGPDEPVMLNGQMVSPAFKATVSQPAADVSSSITVADQDITNGQVTVSNVTSSGPGWLSVNTQGPDGKPGAAIGYTAVKSGTSGDVIVAIDASKATPVLFVMLYKDAGQVGKYEVPGPDTPQEVQGQQVSRSFNTSSSMVMSTAPPATTSAYPAGSSAYPASTPNSATTSVPATANAAGAPGLQPSITVANQAVQNGTVTVPLAVSNGNWWLVIHRQNPDGQMGSYIGEKLLTNGVHTNVVVNIDMNRATSVLYAMLHEDHGIIGVLEFPGPDIPVMINGQMAIPFSLTQLATNVTINTRKLSDSQSFLTDGDGASLYIFLQDSPGKSTCTGACLTVWNPLLVSGQIIAGSGVTASNLGVIILPDGTRQVTYKGYPLYTYTKDLKPGDTNGHGVDGKWLLVTP